VGNQERLYSTDELIELAAGAGCDITRVQLAQWHRWGLLPKPAKRALGRGKGSVSLYPGETGPWLLDLLRVHKREHRRSYVAWRLWWAGRPISMSRVREFMTRAAGKIDEQRTAAAGLSREERTAAAERLYRKELAPAARPLLGRARQRLRGETPSLFGILFDAMSGPFAPGSDELRTLEKASGIARMRGSRPTGEALPELNTFASATIRAWTDAAREPLRPLVDDLTDEQLRSARDAARNLFANLQGSLQMNRELRSSEDVSVTDWYPPDDPTQQVAFVLIWHRVRENAQRIEEGVDPQDASTVAGDMAETYEMIRALRRSPTFAGLLTQSHLREAAKDKVSRERFLKQLSELISQNRDEAEALLRQAGLM
jgi:hypothetical protein